MDFIAFPSIEGLHNVIKAVDVYPHLAGGPVKYRGKIKLHGTNAAVRICNGDFVAQSRTQIITPDNDNAGFARWAESKKDYFKQVFCRGAIPDQLAEGEGILQPIEYTIFGEWAGPSIMKGTAINQIPNKIFAIFAVMEGNATDNSFMITEPTEIARLLGPLPNDIHILPWQGEEFTINFSDRELLQKTADNLNAIIKDIEPCDPWVKSTFGVEGVAEGIVYVPGAGDVVTRKYYSDLAFKAKGEQHKVVKTKQSVQIDPEVAKNVDEFVKLFATEARFEQGMAAINFTEMKQIGMFLKWISQDILKESTTELEASGLEWAQVEKSIQQVTRNWAIKSMHKISV